ncbi:MAG TPA: hypothetical protein VGG30_05075, partial [Pirellulales bacterium]
MLELTAEPVRKSLACNAKMATFVRVSSIFMIFPVSACNRTLLAYDPCLRLNGGPNPAVGTGLAEPICVRFLWETLMAEHEKGLFCFPSLVASRPPVAAARRNVVLTAAALVCGALACTGGSLQASMESFSFSYGPVTVPESSAMVGTLSKFDSTLGTLTEVQLQLVSTTSA